MKKLILSALAAITLTAMPVVAQTQNAEQKTCTQQSCNVGKDGKSAKPFKGNKSRQQACLFEGIQLTEAQKTQLKELKEKQMTEAKAAREKMRDQKHHGDSTLRAARLDAKKEYLNQLKSILGQEAYVKFLENNYLYGGGDRKPQFQGKMDRQKGKDFKGDRKGDRKRGDMKRGEFRKDAKKGVRSAQSAEAQVENAQ